MNMKPNVMKENSARHATLLALYPRTQLEKTTWRGKLEFLKKILEILMTFLDIKFYVHCELM